MQAQVLALVAEQLPALDDDADFRRQPAWSGPVLLGLGATDGCIEQEDIRDTLDRLARRQRLIASALVAPASRLRLAFDAGLEYLAEGRTLAAQRALGSVLVASACAGRAE